MHKFRLGTVAMISLLAFATVQACAAQEPEQAGHTTEMKSIPPADQPTKEQLAHLFEVMRMREQLQSVLKQMPAMLQQSFAMQIKTAEAKMPMASLTDEQKAAVEKINGRYTEKARNLYTADEMIADMSSLYQQHVSREDVDAFIAFYVSPAGQHLLDLTPVMMKEYIQTVLVHVQERSSALVEEMKKELDIVIPDSGAGGTAPRN